MPCASVSSGEDELSESEELLKETESPSETGVGEMGELWDPVDESCRLGICALISGGIASGLIFAHSLIAFSKLSIFTATEEMVRGLEWESNHIEYILNLV